MSPRDNSKKECSINRDGNEKLDCGMVDRQKGQEDRRNLKTGGDLTDEQRLNLGPPVDENKDKESQKNDQISGNHDDGEPVGKELDEGKSDESRG